MADLVSDITCRHQPVRRDLPLDAEIPLLHVRYAGVGTECVEDSVARIRHVLVQDERERNAAREIPIRTVQTAARIDDENFSTPRWTLSRRQVQFDSVDIVEDSVAGANDHLAVFGRVINETNTRPEILPLFVHARISVRTEQRIAGIEHSGRSVHEHIAVDSLQERIHVEMVHHVFAVVLREVWLPAHAVAQREVGFDLPAVLRI